MITTAEGPPASMWSGNRHKPPAQHLLDVAGASEVSPSGQAMEQAPTDRASQTAPPAEDSMIPTACDPGQYFDAVFGDGTGYACGAIGTRPYLDEKGKYRFGRNWREFAFHWPEQRDQLVEVVEGAADARADVYVCPYLQLSSDRSKNNAVERRLVHADIDGEIDVAKIQELGGFAVASGSGGHGHVYVCLSEPVTSDQHAALCRALGRHLGHADAKIADNDLLRPLGSVNRKPTVRGEAAVPVTWLVAP